MSFIQQVKDGVMQPINNNIVQPFINYTYENPYKVATSLAVIGGGIAFVSLGGFVAAQTVIAYAQTHYILTISISTVLSITKPCWNPYIAPYANSLEELSNDYPYVTVVTEVVLAGRALYFGGANILFKNLKNIFTSPIGLGMLGITAMVSAGSVYLSSAEALKIHKSRSDQTISIEGPIDVKYESDIGLVYVPVLGFMSSCIIGDTLNEYFLNDDTDSILKLSVAFGGRALGGIIKYGGKAIAYGQDFFTRIIDGAFNNGYYGLSSMLVKLEIIPSIMDDFASFIAEPGEVIINAAIVSWITGVPIDAHGVLIDLGTAFVVAAEIYNCGKLLLPVVETITSSNAAIISSFIIHNDQIIVDESDVCLAGDNFLHSIMCF